MIAKTVEERFQELRDAEVEELKSGVYRVTVPPLDLPLYAFHSGADRSWEWGPLSYTVQEAMDNFEKFDRIQLPLGSCIEHVYIGEDDRIPPSMQIDFHRDCFLPPRQKRTVSHDR